MDLLAIVPARGGSVGVLRKNTRVIDGKPLVLHKLDTLRAAGLERIVCTTDDPVIASIARSAGYDVHRRRLTAGPSATIADTVTEVVTDLEWTGPVGVFQCTCPAISPERITQACADFITDPGVKTAVAVTPVHDVCWDSSGRHYGEWVNRQDDTPALWRETGGIRLVKDPSILPGMVDMTGHDLIELTEAEALDIDHHRQLAAARQRSVPVVFFAAVGPRVGSGHLHRCLTLADELAHHQVRFRLIHDTDTAPTTGEHLVLGAGHQLLEGAEPAGPAVVVLDVLDSDPAMVWALRQMGHLVVSLEDAGPGAQLAHRQINELYAEGQHAGPDYAVLRPEFLTGRRHLRSFGASADPFRVLLYFGGSEAGQHMANSLVPFLNAWDVVNYTGADGTETVPLAEAMAGADLLITGQGRAVYAAAHVGIPTVSIPLNGREADHLRLRSVYYMARRELVAPAEVNEVVTRLWGAPDLRREMSVDGQAQVDGRGTQRVAQIIDDLTGELQL